MNWQAGGLRLTIEPTNIRASCYVCMMQSNTAHNF